MNYLSTRGGASTDDLNAVLTGLSPDGGLFVPEKMPEVDVKALLELPTLEMGAGILSAVLPSFENMGELVKAAYKDKFETNDIAPLVPLGDDYVMELFHGPTSAFKDVALSMLPHLMTAGRRQTGETGETVILTATSGDTGKAALEGFHDVPGTRIIVFYPDGGVSPIQRRQMVTQQGGNVNVCAVKGNFDDCQSAVKTAFTSLSGSEKLSAKGMKLSSANSINIGRLASQIVYYFSAYASLLKQGRISFGDKVDYVVPTGNFGDILAGYFAREMGLPVGRLVCASNDNKVLTDFFMTGTYDRRRVFIKTSSPSMDILISSNLERLLYMKSGDASLVKDCMDKLKAEGVYTMPESVMSSIRADFCAGYCTEEEAAREIRRVWDEKHYLCDTHTAVAMKVARDYKRQRNGDAPVVILSTASPFKFPAWVLEALGEQVPADEFEQLDRLSRVSGLAVPDNLSALRTMEELHTGSVGREDIIDYILSVLGIE